MTRSLHNPSLAAVYTQPNVGQQNCAGHWKIYLLPMIAGKFYMIAEGVADIIGSLGTSVLLFPICLFAFQIIVFVQITSRIMWS